MQFCQWINGCLGQLLNYSKYQSEQVREESLKKAYVKKKRILPEENLEEKNEILDHTCRKNSSRRKPSGVGRKANPEI